MSLPTGLNDLNVQTTAKVNIDGKEYDYSKKDLIRAYKQDNSVVAGSNLGTGTLAGTLQSGGAFSPYLSNYVLTGNATDQLPTNKTIDYVGKSFSYDKDGTFNYSIDFAKKEGAGKVVLGNTEIALAKASLSQLTNQSGFTGHGIKHELLEDNGLFSYKVEDYTLGIFGKNAEEVAGHGYKQGFGDFGFAGTATDKK